MANKQYTYIKTDSDNKAKLQEYTPSSENDGGIIDLGVPSAPTNIPTINNNVTSMLIPRHDFKYEFMTELSFSSFFTIDQEDNYTYMFSRPINLIDEFSNDNVNGYWQICMYASFREGTTLEQANTWYSELHTNFSSDRTFAYVATETNSTVHKNNQVLTKFRQSIDEIGFTAILKTKIDTTEKITEIYGLGINEDLYDDLLNNTCVQEIFIDFYIGDDTVYTIDMTQLINENHSIITNKSKENLEKFNIGMNGTYKLVGAQPKDKEQTRSLIFNEDTLFYIECDDN